LVVGKRREGKGSNRAPKKGGESKKDRKKPSQTKEKKDIGRGEEIGGGETERSIEQKRREKEGKGEGGKYNAVRSAVLRTRGIDRKKKRNQSRIGVRWSRGVRGKRSEGNCRIKQER